MSLKTRFGQRGNLPDLDETIELCQAALVSTISYRPRSFKEAIELTRAALALDPLAVLISLSINTLPSCLQSRIEQRGIVSDLDEAIDILHPRFEWQHGIPSDLDESIELPQVALALNRSASINSHPYLSIPSYSDIALTIKLSRGIPTLYETGRSLIIGGRLLA
ncbi:uncharacterized protein BJ212DRAFT_1480247 [Suillus subaureus]|uniref:Uncharacterized protein n=1 Tax=Suillus subaureus TaxID=48587 RepID=A0A9P7ED59_9AGAM|nr:uncharacterized protein BJ212DRAFT_1480247 [Suillus subaureus]KAG1817700.1 hypothetical protein BJ212DRAFT_1480247 [Suillus subaureus]